ncbi:MAG: glycosyltransferase family 9 protein [Bacteriovoracia bacterium]
MILSTAALGTAAVRQSDAHWLTRKEYASLLESHPALSRVWAFDRARGLLGWVVLSSELFSQGYDTIYDLQGSLRTRLMRVLFFLLGLFKTARAPRWRSYRKPRLKAYGYYLFKRRWPKAWRPGQRVAEFSRAVGGTGEERPDLRYLFAKLPTGWDLPAELREGGRPKRYLAVMPDSLWEGKRWSIDFYVDWLRAHGGVDFGLPVVLGTKNDVFSRTLVERLADAQIPHYSGVDRFTWAETAAILGGAQAYVGGDTGLAHLAEAVGTPALVIFGPTAADAGFGPWRAGSQAIGSSLGCRPCGKDGRYCYRFWNRHQCMKEVSPSQVQEALLHVVAAK